MGFLLRGAQGWALAWKEEQRLRGLSQGSPLPLAPPAAPTLMPLLVTAGGGHSEPLQSSCPPSTRYKEEKGPDNSGTGAQARPGGPAWGAASGSWEGSTGDGVLNCLSKGVGTSKGSEGVWAEEACTWARLSGELVEGCYGGVGEKQVRSHLGLTVPGPMCAAVSPPP